MTDRELMQQALDALEWCYDVTEWPANGKSAQDKAIEALRARLAQPEQEHSEQWWRHEVSNAWAEGYEKGRLQREWIGLTDEEILEEYRQSYGDAIHDEPNGLLEFVRAIEAKLKEKNT